MVQMNRAATRTIMDEGELCGRRSGPRKRRQIEQRTLGRHFGLAAGFDQSCK